MNPTSLPSPSLVRPGLAGSRLWCLAILLVLCVSCSASDGTESTAATAVEAAPTPVVEPTTPAAATATAMPEPSPAPVPTPTFVTQEPTPVALETATVQPTETPTPEPNCVTITDFSVAEANAQWLVVNDNVMGGRSAGDRSFDNATMRFAGSINTNGGGFASLRLPLAPLALSGAEYVAVTARSDGRSYLLTFDDSVEGRNRRISFRGLLEFTTPGEWETVQVPLAGLYAAIFGQPVEAEPFEPDLATRLGIMLSDGLDGDFQLDVDRIEACR